MLAEARPWHHLHDKEFSGIPAPPQKAPLSTPIFLDCPPLLELQTYLESVKNKALYEDARRFIRDHNMFKSKASPMLQLWGDDMVDTEYGHLTLIMDEEKAFKKTIRRKLEKDKRAGTIGFTNHGFKELHKYASRAAWDASWTPTEIDAKVEDEVDNYRRRKAGIEVWYGASKVAETTRIASFLNALDAQKIMEQEHGGSKITVEGKHFLSCCCDNLMEMMFTQNPIGSLPSGSELTFDILKESCTAVIRGEIAKNGISEMSETHERYTSGILPVVLQVLQYPGYDIPMSLIHLVSSQLGLQIQISDTVRLCISSLFGFISAKIIDLAMEVAYDDGDTHFYDSDSDDETARSKKGRQGLKNGGARRHRKRIARYKIDVKQLKLAINNDVELNSMFDRVTTVSVFSSGNSESGTFHIFACHFFFLLFNFSVDWFIGKSKIKIKDLELSFFSNIYIFYFYYDFRRKGGDRKRSSTSCLRQ